MSMTVATAQTHLDAWLAADLALATAQSYSLSTPGGSRTLTRANVQEVRDQIAYWQRVVNDLTARAAGGRPRLRNQLK